MKHNISKFVRFCNVYQSQNTSHFGLMGAGNSVKYAFQVTAVDIMEPFPHSSRGFCYLLLVTDFFTIPYSVQCGLLSNIKLCTSKVVWRPLYHFLYTSTDYLEYPNSVHRRRAAVRCDLHLNFLIITFKVGESYKL